MVKGLGLRWKPIRADLCVQCGLHPYAHSILMHGCFPHAIHQKRSVKQTYYQPMLFVETLHG